jgi:tetratricopeptide (TPR) repeat protein
MQFRDSIDFQAIKLLAQTGLLAAWEGMFVDSEAIFEGAQRVYPDVPQIRNSMALAAFTGGRHGEAIEILQEAMLTPGAELMAKSMLAFVLQQAGRTGWQQLAREVLNKGGDVAAIELASHVLGETMPTANPGRKVDATSVRGKYA